MAKANQMVVKLTLTSETLPLASKALRELTGIDKLEQLTPQRLRITYDVTQTNWATLRERLQAVGAPVQTGVLARWRDSWREFLEQNMRDNLRHKPACCSKAPTGGGFRSHSHHDN